MRKKILSVLLALILALSASGCADTRNFESYRPITDLNDLGGRKVGVNLGWAADMLLSNRDDIILYRYDETADMLMALCYKQLDAIATEDINTKQILGCTTGLRKVDGMLTMDDYVGVFSDVNADLMEEFNQWIAVYKETEDYSAWIQRLEEFDGQNYEWPCGPWPTEGTPIVVGAYESDFPMSFIGQGQTACGYDLELFHRFCCDRGYAPDMQLIPEESIFMGMKNHKIDMLFGDYSILYKNETEASGYLCSESYRRSPICVVEIADPDNLEISGIPREDLEEDEEEE